MSGMVVQELFSRLGIKTDKRSFDKARDELGRFQKQGDSRMKQFGVRLAKGLGGVAKRGALAAGGVLAAGFTKAFNDEMDFDKALGNLLIGGRGTLGTVDEMRTAFNSASKAVNVNRNELAAGAQKFVELTGNGESAKNMLTTFGRVAKASGSDMEDIAGVAATLSQNMGIADKDMESAFSTLIAGGKMGRVELKNMASLLPSLGAQFQNFAGGKGVEGVQSLGAAFQVAAESFGSPAEAATGLEALMGAVIKNAKRLRKEGVKGLTFVDENGVTKFNSLRDIVERIGESKLAKNPELLFEALGRKEAVTTFQALTKIPGKWDHIAKATKGAKDVAEDYAKRQKMRSEQISRQFNNLKIKIAEAMTPERVEALSKALMAVVEAAGWVLDKFVKLGEAIGVTAGKIAEELGLDTRGSAASRAESRRKTFKGKSMSDLEAIANDDRGFSLQEGAAGFQKRVRRRELAGEEMANRRQRTIQPVANALRRAEDARLQVQTRASAPLREGLRSMIQVGAINVTSTKADEKAVAKEVVKQINAQNRGMAAE